MRRALLAAALALSACDSEIAAGRTAATPSAETLAPPRLPAFFNCLRESGAAIVSAHRGGPRPGYAENALATFEATLTAAPVIIEVDVRRTRDGRLVLMHDDTLDRTTNGAGPISALTLAEIQALRLRDETGAVLDERPPSLRQALDWAEGRTVLQLDIKRDVRYEELVAEVRAAGAGSRVIIITPSASAAARVQALGPEMMISAPVGSAADIDALARHRIASWRVLAWTGIEAPDPELNAAIAANGFEVLFGTLGGAGSLDARFAREGNRYAAIAQTGVQMIATDRPAEAVADLDAHDGAEGYAALQCVGAR